MTVVLNDQAAADVVAALGILPEEVWDVGDDLCDCTFQRIGMWTNPYINQTLQVRACCIWKELYKLFPQFVREVPAFLDYNNGDTWKDDPMEWNADFDMPRAIWYRQLVSKTGRPIAEIRAEYADKPVPRGLPRPVVEEEPMPDPIEILWEAVMGLAEEVFVLREKVKA